MAGDGVVKQLGNTRKAYASKGDDCTFTRWVKMPGRHSGHKTPPMPTSATGTRFPNRVLRVRDMATLLVSGHANIKVGRDVRKGRFKGYWIYTLSLEERATCPRTCQHWTDCYGNAMPFAKRIDHTDPALLPTLDAEIAARIGQRGRIGVLIRLHALGDFYSLPYINFWIAQLLKHPNLAIFGYTAHAPNSRMGRAIQGVKSRFGRRFAIRWSNGGLDRDCTVGITKSEDCPSTAFVCPEQTDKVAGCGKCGACWTGDKNVAFIAH